MADLLLIRSVLFLIVGVSSVLAFIFALLPVIRFGFSGLAFYGFFISGITITVVTLSLVYSRLKPGVYPWMTKLITELCWSAFLALLWVSWGGITVGAISIGIWGLINFFCLTGWAITLTVFGAKNNHWKSDVCQTDITQKMQSSHKTAEVNQSVRSFQSV